MTVGGSILQMAANLFAFCFVTIGALALAYGMVGLPLVLSNPDPVKYEQYLRIGFTCSTGVFGAGIFWVGAMKLRDARRKSADRPESSRSSNASSEP